LRVAPWLLLPPAWVAFCVAFACCAFPSAGELGISGPFKTADAVSKTAEPLVMLSCRHATSVEKTCLRIRYLAEEWATWPSTGAGCTARNRTTPGTSPRCKV